MPMKTLQENEAVLRDTPLARIKGLYRLMAACRLCPRACGVARLNGNKTGVCNSGVRPAVASCTLHFGEEPPISGTGGSGTVFFSGCAMRCVFCQNFPISQLGVGRTMSVSELADKMVALQKRGAENINFVTPTHFAAQAAHAVYIARRRGLKLPVVWNTSGYESVETLRLLEGFVDVYLCDYRYLSRGLAQKYSRTRDYPGVIEAVIAEMLRQTGPFDGHRGVIIRHLVMPSHLEETRKVLERIVARFGHTVPVSYMSQFFPAHKAAALPEIGRRLSEDELEEAWKILAESGLENGWIQEEPPTESNSPDEAREG